MKKAFLVVESALAYELATPSRICMSEDYLRVSLVRGLSYSLPNHASRVTSELDASWTTNNCWNDLSHGGPTGRGRPIQHDVAVSPGPDDKGLICEVKWLKHAQGPRVAKDIWKLALSRGLDAEGQALRTYLLIGGEGDALSTTLRTLQNKHVNIRWSNAGRTFGTPAPRNINLKQFFSTPLGREALLSQLGWGNHYREPPETWKTLRLIVRSVWYRTADTARWRVILFEFDHRGTGNNDTMDWASIKSNILLLPTCCLTGTA